MCIKTRKNVGIVMVLKESRGPEIAGKPITFRSAMRVMQVRRVLVIAKIDGIVMRRRQIIMETHQDRYVVKIQDCRAWIDAVVAPDIGWGHIRMKGMQRR